MFYIFKMQKGSRDILLSGGLTTAEKKYWCWEKILSYVQKIVVFLLTTIEQNLKWSHAVKLKHTTRCKEMLNTLKG